MFLLEWYQRWLEIRSIYKRERAELTQENKICASCETLKLQLEIANYEKQQLLNRLLAPPVTEERPVAPEPTTVLRPRNVPWAVRRQMLEREDRIKAATLRNAAKPDSVATEELEKELNVAEQTRESENA